MDFDNVGKGRFKWKLIRILNINIRFKFEFGCVTTPNNTYFQFSNYNQTTFYQCRSPPHVDVAPRFLGKKENYEIFF